MTAAFVPTHRTRGRRTPVAIPADLTTLHGPTSGPVQLPLRVYSSGTGPDHVFNLDDPAALYSIVMENGTEADVANWLDHDTLRRLWPTLWVSPHVREAWAPHLDTHVEHVPDTGTA